jgi:hypothetical protein
MMRVFRKACALTKEARASMRYGTIRNTESDKKHDSE